MAETPTCPKCGDGAQRYAYLEEENRLHLTCERCGYAWRALPLDARRQRKPK